MELPIANPLGKCSKPLVHFCLNGHNSIFKKKRITTTTTPPPYLAFVGKLLICFGKQPKETVLLKSGYLLFDSGHLSNSTYVADCDPAVWTEQVVLL